MNFNTYEIRARHRNRRKYFKLCEYECYPDAVREARKHAKNYYKVAIVHVRHTVVMVLDHVER